MLHIVTYGVSFCNIMYQEPVAAWVHGEMPVSAESSHLLYSRAALDVSEHAGLMGAVPGRSENTNEE